MLNFVGRVNSIAQIDSVEKMVLGLKFKTASGSPSGGMLSHPVKKERNYHRKCNSTCKESMMQKCRWGSTLTPALPKKQH